MKRNITKTFDSLVKMFINHDDVSVEEAEEMAHKTLSDPKTNLRYYVTLGDFSMCDIAGGAMVKTPCKYFKNLDHAKLYQLKRITADLEAVNQYSERRYDYSYEEVEDMYLELKELSEEYPEYDI